MTLKAQRRSEKGTRVCRALRAQGLLPAIVYGHREAPERISLPRHDVEVALGHGARTLQVDVDGKLQPCLIKEVQYDYLHKSPIHLDLARVDLHERVRVRVGIELRGVPKGVSDGGVLDQHMAYIEVECTVTDIPDTLHPIILHLGLGESLYVKDLPLPPGVKPLAAADDRVATVRELAAIPEPVAAPAVEGEAQPAEPERIGRVRKEETEEGEG
jgi:large subunit ribosomal protein L25